MSGNHFNLGAIGQKPAQAWIVAALVIRGLVCLIFNKLKKILDNINAYLPYASTSCINTAAHSAMSYIGKRRIWLP